MCEAARAIVAPFSLCLLFFPQPLSFLFPLPPPLSRLQEEGSPTYMSVKDAMLELKQATLYSQQHAPASVRMPPVWASVHAAESQRMGRYSPTRSTTAPPMRPPGGATPKPLMSRPP